jgi:uncharacterized protein YndB with AHSA1/START domain
VTTDPQAERRGVVLRREWPDPIEDVWAALTESERTARWIGTYVGSGSAGGTVEFTLTGEVDAGGEVAPPVTVTIVECDPPHRLVVDIPEGDGAPWRVAVTLTTLTTLTAERGRTQLLFEQRVIEGVDPAAVEAGWSWYLDRLGACMHGEPMPAWTEYAPTEESA